MASAVEIFGASGNDQPPPEFNQPIFQVPDHVRKVMKSAYEPIKVFFGPYHHMKSNGDIQGKYKISLLSRYRDVMWEKYLDGVRTINLEARICYSDLDITDEDFVRIMTNDGCVILELINKLLYDDERRNLNWSDVCPILEEMMLLENQIPFIVLEKIWQVSGAEEEWEGDLVDIFLWQMRDKYSPDPGVYFPIERNTPVFHLVHLLQLVMFPSPSPTVAPSGKSLPSLSELLKRGVKLKRNDQARGLKVSFSYGVLTINPLKISTSTDKYMGNLIAFEQCYKFAKHYASNYFKLMCSLIQKIRDVDALVSANILSIEEEERKYIDIVDLFKTLAGVIKEYEDDQDCNPTTVFEWVNNLENSYMRIFRVPDHIRNLKPSAYEPTLISFGPYHHGKDQLKTMERQKWMYRNKLLERYSNKTWENCLNAVREIEDQVRQFYEGPLNLSNDKDFVEMMALDGCFQIEIITNKKLIQTQPNLELEKQTLNVIHRDMMLLENQLPFIVLRVISKYLADDDVLMRLLQEGLLRFLREACCGTDNIQDQVTINIEQPPWEEILHIVDLLGRYMFPTAANARGHLRGILSLSKLKRRGLQVERTENSGLGVSFTPRYGPLRINHHNIHSNTDAHMRNLIAFEQIYWGAKKTASRYVVLMNSLIRTTEDVDVLSCSQTNILTNNLTSEEEVVDLFKNLCKGIKDFEAGEIYQELWTYGRSNRREWWRELREDYFKSPWKAVAFGGAVSLLVLALVQTIFTIKAYKKS